MDIVEMSRTLIEETAGSTENLRKFPENRLVSAIATVQRTSLSVFEESNSLFTTIMDELENRANVVQSSLISREPTRNFLCVFYEFSLKMNLNLVREQE